MVRYNELVQLLQETYAIQPRSGGCSPVITDIRLLDGNEQQWHEHVLYVGSIAELKSPPHQPIMLLAVDEPPALPEGSCYAKIRNEDLYDLFKAAQEFIAEDLRGDAIFFELAQMALYEKNIAGIINTAAALLGNALILVNSAHKVLVHSTNYEIVDPLWVQNIERGYYSYEFVQKVRTNRDMQEWSKQGSETQLITLPGDKQPKLVARITQEGHVIGALIMIEHHTPIGRIHLRLLPMVGKLLFDAFNRETASGSVHGSLYSSILYNLLDESDISNTLEYINLSRISFPAEMVVVVARYVLRMENRFLKRAFSTELERIFPQGHPVQYKSYMGILVPSVSVKQTDQLAKLAQNENVSVGLSWPFVDIVDFKRHFYQAVTAIKLAQRFGRTSRVFDYSDFYYYDLLNNYTGKIPLQQYCHPALKVLRDYDRDNGTELYATLRTYLENEKNLRATAEALFIHRNTLIYRINRINQLIKLDLGNIQVAHALMDSFRIEKFLNYQQQ